MTVGIHARPKPVVIFAEPKPNLRAFSLGSECFDVLRDSVPEQCLLTASGWHIWVFFAKNYHWGQKQERMAISHLTYMYIFLNAVYLGWMSNDITNAWIQAKRCTSDIQWHYLHTRTENTKWSFWLLQCVHVGENIDVEWGRQEDNGRNGPVAAGWWA